MFANILVLKKHTTLNSDVKSDVRFHLDEVLFYVILQKFAFIEARYFQILCACNGCKYTRLDHVSFSYLSVYS